MNRVRSSGNVAATAVIGALAGLGATFVMDRVTVALRHRESAAGRAREQRINRGRLPFEVAADRASLALRRGPLDRHERRIWGRRLRYGLGAAVGAAYGAWYARHPDAGLARGLGTGAAYFVGVHELLNPLLGITPGPAELPWEAHARGLAGHLAYGLSTHAALAALRRPLEAVAP